MLFYQGFPVSFFYTVFSVKVKREGEDGDRQRFGFFAAGGLTGFRKSRGGCRRERRGLQSLGGKR